MMKKGILITAMAFLLTACGTATYVQEDCATAEYRHLRIGMTRVEVFTWLGRPELALDARYTSRGYYEVLQYRNCYGEPFALEFENNYLVAANYVYDGMYYSMYPHAIRPGIGRPAFPSGYRPNRPYYPPTVRPPQTSRPPASPRPPANNSRPESTTRPSTRPSGNERPSSSATERPGTRPSSGSETTRPSTRPSSSDNNRSSTRESSNVSNSRTSTRESSSTSSSSRSSGTTRSSSSSGTRSGSR